MNPNDKLYLIKELAADCENWSFDELINFAFDRLWNEYTQMSDEELIAQFAAKEQRQIELRTAVPSDENAESVFYPEGMKELTETAIDLFGEDVPKVSGTFFSGGKY